MNENMKYGLFFLGGLALGAIGAVAVSKGKLDLKPMAADLLSRGMDVKDAVLAKVETVSALSLYRQLGFTVKGMRKNYYSEPKEDAYIMSLIKEEGK